MMAFSFGKKKISTHTDIEHLIIHISRYFFILSFISNDRLIFFYSWIHKLDLIMTKTYYDNFFFLEFCFLFWWLIKWKWNEHECAWVLNNKNQLLDKIRFDDLTSNDTEYHYDEDSENSEHQLYRFKNHLIFSDKQSSLLL